MEHGQNNKRVIFLDRDGVINRLIVERGPRETPCTVDDLELLPRVVEAMSSLRKVGFDLVIVTNQPNIAKGKSTIQDYEDINCRLKELLGREAAVLDTYACTHHPDSDQVVVPELLQECSCRKPEPGLFLQAIKQHQIDVNSSWMVGDAKTDIEAGERAGVPTNHLLFIGSPYSEHIRAVNDLFEASQLILTLER